MRNSLTMLSTAILLTALIAPAPAQKVAQDKAKYSKRYEDPVLKEMEANRKVAAEALDKTTRDIRDRQTKFETKKEPVE